MVVETPSPFRLFYAGKFQSLCQNGIGTGVVASVRPRQGKGIRTRCFVSVYRFTVPTMSMSLMRIQREPPKSPSATSPERREPGEPLEAP